MRLGDNVSLLVASIRQATQRFWATSVIFFVGVASSAFMIWVYSEITYQVSSHLPLVAQTGELSFRVSQAHLSLEKYLQGHHDVTAADVKKALHRTVKLADTILAQVEFCEGEDFCPMYNRYCPEMREFSLMMAEFVEKSLDRIRRGHSDKNAAAFDEIIDERYLSMLKRVESLQQILTGDVEDRKARLEKVLAGVIVFWASLLALVFLVTKSKEKHRERFLEALRSAEEKVRTFISTAGDMIYFQAPDGSISDYNHAVTEMSGYSAREFVGDPQLWIKMLHPDDVDSVLNLLKQPPYRKPTLEMQYRLRTREGDWLWIHSKRSVVTDEAGKFLGYNCIDRDITEDRQSAEEYERTSRMLRERVKEQHCLYGVCQVVRDTQLPLEEAMKQVLGLVEQAFQYPEITRARIVVDGQTYARQDFKASQWVIRNDIVVAGQKAGLLETYYIEHRPAADNGPFLSEEIQLMDSVAAKIGAHLTRREFESDKLQRGKFLSSVINSLPYPFLVIDAADYTVKMANAVSGANLSEGEVKCHKLTHGQDEPCSSAEHPCPIREVIESGRPVVVEHIHTDREGNHHYHEVNAYPIVNESGQVIQVIEYFLDITERKVTESKLGELAAFPANNPNIVMSLNVDGEVLYMNSATAAALRRLGVSPKNADECLPSNTAEIIARCARSGSGVLNIVTEVRNRTWTWSFHPVVGKNIIHCYATDITDLVKQENEVRLLSAAVDQSSNMICMTDPEGLIQYVNPFFTRVTGYSLEDVAGKPVSILKSGEHDTPFYQDMWDTITAGQTWTGNVRNRRSSGELYWERKTITPIQDEHGEIVNFLSVSNDITSELRTQQKLIEADKLSAIGTLAAGVAHEFKNYLGGIIGNASYALEELKSEGGLKLAGDTLAKIVHMGERANDVAMSLLTYSRSKPEDRQPEDIGKLIEKSTKLVEKELRNQSIEIVTYYEDLPLIEVSASKIQQLILNLLINARHAIKSHGVITIALFNRGHGIEVRVGDTGIGIPRDNLEKIFDPFFSTKGVWGKDEVTGTGIGLSICRNIAREHGGDLNVESIVGMGTTFTLTLPTTPDYFQSRVYERHHVDSLTIMIFSLDKSIVSHYYDRACQFNARLLAADDISFIPDDLAAVADLVICDSKFTGKLELYRMIEKCRDTGVPFVMVNCGASEYELAELHGRAVANFKELPDLERVVNLVLAGKAASPDTSV